MKSKNNITIFLMVSSMVLLAVLQVFWLRSAYERAYFSFRGRTGEIFRGSVFAVRDSILFQQIEALPTDSAIGVNTSITFTRHIDPKTIPTVPGTQTVNIRKQGAETEMIVFSKSRPDSIKSMIRVFANRFDEGKLKGNTKYIIRMSGDSLNIDSISAQFGRAIVKADLSFTFQIKKSKTLPFFHARSMTPEFERTRRMNRDSLKIFGNVFQSDWVRVDPLNEYAAVIGNIRPILLKEIAPQIFFSAVLTVVTLISFMFMYRNIRSQQRLMTLKNDFISNVTHELKTPIATVSVALEALKNFRGIDDPKRTGEYLDIAQHELTRLSVLTEKVLTMSLFDEKGIRLEYEKVNLEQVINEALSSLSLVFEKHQAKMEFIKTGDDFYLEGSAVHLTNVIHNLLDNAMKYSPSSPEIRIALSDLGKNLSLAVSDKGLGIPGEFHDKVFEKFFRMPTGDVHTIKGYGLGLSYVDSVVKSHGGTISVTSIPGEGSTFTIVLPKANNK